MNTIFNMARFAGLIQTDGGFYVTLRDKGTLAPKIVFSQSAKRWDWLQDYIIPLLKKEGISYSIYPKTKQEALNYQHAVNITIYNKDNILKLIKLFDDLKDQGISIFKGKKLLDFLIFKEFFKLADNMKSTDKIISEQSKCKRIDLKILLGQSRTGPKGKTRFEWEEMLGLKKDQSIEASQEIWTSLNKQVEQQNIKNRTLITNKKLILTDTLGFFIAGIFDGDGSFQVAALTHLDPKKTNEQKGIFVAKKEKDYTRRMFEFVPMLTITDELSHIHPIVFEIISYIFGDTSVIPKYSKNQKSVRLYIKKHRTLQKALSFFKKYQVTIPSNIKRFEVFKYCFEVREQIYRDEKTALQIVDLIYNNETGFDSDKKKRPKEQFKLIVKAFFKSKEKL